MVFPRSAIYNRTYSLNVEYLERHGAILEKRSRNRAGPESLSYLFLNISNEKKGEFMCSALLGIPLT